MSPLSPDGGLQAANDFRNVLLQQELLTRGGGAQDVSLDDECLEKRVFHRLISGMHASISTHLCWEYLNQSTGQWHPNLQCYRERLHDHPERISNLYFNYALVSRAVAKLRKHLETYTFCSSDPAQDSDTRSKLSQLTKILAERPQIFDENIMFQNPAEAGLKEDFRTRFRNVSRLMDCVGCDKCRLWGKLQVNGYGTALKVLFEYDETKNGENPPLRRTELVALVNTLGRISHSLSAARSFHQSLQQLDAGGHDVRKDGADPDPSASSPPRQLVKDGGSTFWYEDDDGADFRYVVDDGSNNSPLLPWERPRRETDGLWDEISAEFEVVWSTYVYVLKSWVYLPRTL